MTDVPVVVSHARLRDFIAAVLEALKMSPSNAALTAELMVRTDLRGVDSHGIGMLPKYVEWTRAGFIDPAAEPVIVRDDMATALLDGQKGLGHPVSVMAMDMALTKAATYGIGIVAVRNSNHFGACANYSTRALTEKDFTLTPPLRVLCGDALISGLILTTEHTEKDFNVDSGTPCTLW